MTVRRLEKPPSTLPIYARAALRSVPVIGSLPLVGGGGDDVPDLEFQLDGVAADPGEVAEYCRVCGFTVRNELPPTYPHILAFPLHMALLTDSSFPFGAVGLVHIGNRITQHRPIEVGEPLALSVRATKLAPHPKGTQFSLLTEVRVAGDVVWESTSTNLRRGDGDESSARDDTGLPDPTELPATAEWRLPGDLGRRYAAVSGDRNPIHMYGLTAKAFGFPRQIAHGMWTKARCLAALEGRLPGTFTVEVRFLKPILLPAKVTFADAKEGERIEFGVRDAKKAIPHLAGLAGPA